jgi:hypothetical protein
MLNEGGLVGCTSNRPLKRLRTCHTERSEESDLLICKAERDASRSLP